MNLSRRTFLDRTAVGLLSSGAFAIGGVAAHAEESSTGHKPVVISTWPFGKPANDIALAVLQRNGAVLDAVEQGIRSVESDASNHSVGLGGKPNAAGVVQLDACIMLGPGHRAGSVAALEGIKHPISAARLVMEKTPHVMLAGEGARMFALEHGLESVAIDSVQRYEAWQRQKLGSGSSGAEGKRQNHDTIALLALSSEGLLAGGCSTSGLAGKLPGRVGDSPILGSGLYVDQDAGAAGATGVGENVMRYCASFMIVEFMRQGLHPQAACERVIQRIARQDPKGFDLSINFIALDKQGRFGAAGTDNNFEFAAARAESSRVLKPVLVP